MAKYYQLGPDDVLLTILTDSMELYGSRLQEMHAEMGEYTELNAAAHQARYLLGERTDNMLELSEQDRRRIHNLKYFTWVEQQGKTYGEIMAQWNDANYWTSVQRQVPEIDALIEQFNSRVGLLN
jgi:type II secretory pathway component PulJ